MLEDFKSIVQKSKEAGFVTLVTHDGIFHADDLFCTGILELFFSEIGVTTQVIRTRDISKVPNQDNLIVYDVFDGILDHHYYGTRPKKRNRPILDTNFSEDDRILASIGKLWRFGKEEFCRVFEIDERMWKRLDKEIVAPLDTTDHTGEMNPMTYYINCLRNTRGGETKTWRLCLDHVKEVWTVTLNDAKNLMKDTKRMADLPVFEVNGKRFKISDSFCGGCVEDLNIKGIIWKKETGTYGIKCFGKTLLSKRNITKSEIPGVIYVHPSGKNGEVESLSDFCKIV